MSTTPNRSKRWFRKEIGSSFSCTACRAVVDRGLDVISNRAEALGRLSKAAEVDRIVYLGGPEPIGTMSEHLKSRLKTGKTLRDSGVPTFELQAGMIMGAGSESWLITRDLSARLPVMIMPKWLQNRSEPIAIRDVVEAIVFALDVDPKHAGAWGLPGPERMTYADILMRVASLRGTKPFTFPVPLLTPKLSSHWLRFVTRADMNVASELVEGLHDDLICEGDGFFTLMPTYERMPFDEAALRALRGEERDMPVVALAIERVIKFISPKS